MTAPSPPQAPLPFWRMLAFSSPGLLTAIVALMMNTYMPRFYAGLPGLSLASVGAAFALVRLIDVPFDPILGLLIDRTHLRFGRYRLWLLVSVPVLLASFWALFLPPPGVGTTYLVAWLLLYNIGASVVFLSHYPWAAALAPDYSARSRLFALIQFLNVIGSVGILLLPVLTHGRVSAGKASSMGPIGIIIMILVPVCVGLVALFTPEPASRRQHQDQSWRDLPRLLRHPSVARLVAADFCLFFAASVTAPIQVFFLKDLKGLSVAEISVLLVFAVAGGLFGTPFWTRVAVRRGKHRAMQLACLTHGIAHLLLVALPRAAGAHQILDLAPIAFAELAIGFSTVAYLFLLRAMAGDVSDEVRHDLHQERTSLIYSLVTTTSKIGAALTVAVTFSVLAKLGYRAAEGAVNGPAAIHGLLLLYLLAPITFLILGAATFQGYRLDSKRHGAIRAALADRAREGA